MWRQAKQQCQPKRQENRGVGSRHGTTLCPKVTHPRAAAVTAEWSGAGALVAHALGNTQCNQQSCPYLSQGARVFSSPSAQGAHGYTLSLSIWWVHLICHLMRLHNLTWGCESKQHFGLIFQKERLQEEASQENRACLCAALGGATHTTAVEVPVEAPCLAPSCGHWWRKGVKWSKEEGWPLLCELWKGVVARAACGRGLENLCGPL